MNIFDGQRTHDPSIRSGVNFPLQMGSGERGINNIHGQPTTWSCVWRLCKLLTIAARLISSSSASRPLVSS